MNEIGRRGSWGLNLQSFILGAWQRIFNPKFTVQRAIYSETDENRQKFYFIKSRSICTILHIACCVTAFLTLTVPLCYR